MTSDDERLQRMAAEFERTAMAVEKSTRAARGAAILRETLRLIKEDIAQGAATDEKLEQSLSIGQALRLGPNEDAAADMVRLCEAALERSQRSHAAKISRVLKECFKLAPTPAWVQASFDRVRPGISEDSSTEVTQKLGGYIDELRLHKKARELTWFTRLRCRWAARRG